MYLGLKFYSDVTMSPINRLLSSNGISLDNPLCTFTDSSWNDDIDTGRSSRYFMIFYMGGVVECNSNMPDPVALSSAEAEYNEACLACMATAHLKQFLEIWSCFLQMIGRARSQFRSSLTIGVQLTWVQVSRIHREHDI